METRTWAVGDTIAGTTRQMTRDRVIWYEDGLTSAVLNHGGAVRVNAHTDLDYAKANGLDGLLGDGMLSTNWLSSLLFSTFGESYLTSGYLRTKFIKPTYVGMWVTPGLELTAIDRGEDGVDTLTFDVWTKDSEGALLTVGEAKVRVE
jgi:acyl dehydratase